MLVEKETQTYREVKSVGTQTLRTSTCNPKTKGPKRSPSLVVAGVGRKEIRGILKSKGGKGGGDAPKQTKLSFHPLTGMENVVYLIDEIRETNPSPGDQHFIGILIPYFLCVLPLRLCK